MNESNEWTKIDIITKTELKKLINDKDKKNRQEIFHNFIERLKAEGEFSYRFKRSEIYLIRFLRARNFNLEYSLKALHNYEALTSAGWKNINLKECQKLISQGAVQVLPKRDPITGRRIVWLRPARWSPSVHDSDMFMKTGALSADVVSLETSSQKAGVVVLFDLADFGLSQLRALSPTFAKKLVHLLANCLPVRVHSVHLLNEPQFFSMVFAIYKKFIDDRMKKRLFFHGRNMISLHKHISSRILPRELGGSAPTMDASCWANAIGQNNIIKELRDFGYHFTDLQ